MPLVFVHGVNVRDDELYREEVLLRNQLMLNVFFPLAGISVPGNNLYDAFWGDLAPAHRPGNLYLPPVEPLSVKFRKRAQIHPVSSAETALANSPVSSMSTSQEVAVESFEDAEHFTDDHCDDDAMDQAPAGGTLLNMLKSESIGDLLDTLVAFAHDERGDLDLEKHSQNVSRMALRAIEFARKLQTMEAQQLWLKDMRTDEELLSKLADELEQEQAQPNKKYVPFKLSRDALRRSRQWMHEKLQSARSRILTPGSQERLLVRAKVAVRNRARAATTKVAARTMNPARHFLHSRLANFIGDSFFYFGKRGTPENPGEVPARIISTLEDAAATRSAEDPHLIVVAHSMGGIVMCDIVSYFRPDLNVDFLVTVGSQFPLFADLCMFPGLDQSALPIARPRNVKKWLNIYDPSDFLGFAAEQLFEGIIDVPYASGKIGIGSHADYFKLPSFYECMARSFTPLVAASNEEEVE